MTDQPLSWIDEELAALERRGLLRRPAWRTGPQGPRLVVQGRRLVNFASNDYLGLAAEERLLEAVAQATERNGWGSGASPLVIGRSTTHAELDSRLAEFERTEAAVSFSSGFAANVGTLAALVGRGDVVFSDQRNHASIIDGCRLSRANVQVYPHCDVDALDDLLRGSGTFRRRLIVTDSLFSMDGDLAPLAELVELAERHGAMLMADETHATGVFGRHGRGVAEHLGVDSQVHVLVGALSKALGSVGGFVAGSRALVHWLVHRARPYFFSTSPPAAMAAAAIAALEIVCDEPERRRQLLRRAGALRDRLRSAGWNLGDSQSQIIPLIVGPADDAMRLSGALAERGLLVPAIRPPSVPEGHSLLRISLSSAHTLEMIDQLVAALKQLHGLAAVP